MNLDPDPRSERFRAEVRAWLRANVPDPPLPSVNTAAGFAAHREWERAAALSLGANAATTARDISAARVACADAARQAARTALQVHGAIGYTLECDVSLWLANVRALSATWGSQSEHRATVLAALQDERTGAWL